MNIGKEGKAFVAEPLTEPKTEEVEAPETTEEVLVPIADTSEHVTVTA